MSASGASTAGLFAPTTSAAQTASALVWPCHANQPSAAMIATMISLHRILPQHLPLPQPQLPAPQPQDFLVSQQPPAATSGFLTAQQPLFSDSFVIRYGSPFRMRRGQIHASPR